MHGAWPRSLRHRPPQIPTVSTSFFASASWSSSSGLKDRRPCRSCRHLVLGPEPADGDRHIPEGLRDRSRRLVHRDIRGDHRGVRGARCASLAARVSMRSTGSPRMTSASAVASSRWYRVGGFENPFVTLKPLKTRKPIINPLSLDEIFKFLEHVPGEFRNYYVVRFFTGLRTAEVDGLKWQCVDFEKKKINVRETWQRTQWVSPKSESSVRDIDISAIVEDALLKQREATGDGELVFRNKKGKPFNLNSITRSIWFPTLQESCVSNQGMHIRPVIRRRACG